MLVFEEGIDHIHFFVKYLEYHQFIAELPEEEYLITNFASLCGPFRETSNALYTMSNKLRELFNLSRRVSLNEQDLRRYFGYILQLSNEKLQKAVTIDKDVILFVESVDRMKDSVCGASAKNWLPKSYPRRIKCVMTCSEGKHEQIASRLNCHKVYVRNKTPVQDRIKEIWAPFKTEVSAKEDTNEVEKKKESLYDLNKIFQKTEVSKSKKASSTSFQNNSKDSKEKEPTLPEYNNKIISIFQGYPASLRENYSFAQLYFGLLIQHPQLKGVNVIDEGLHPHQ